MQPQWVVDSANFRVLADAGRYVPGATLPPHLSPFAGDGPDGEDHVPDYQLELQRLQVPLTCHLCLCVLCGLCVGGEGWGGGTDCSWAKRAAAGSCSECQIRWELRH